MVDLFAAKTAPRRSVSLVLDQQLLADYEAAKNAADTAQRAADLSNDAAVHARAREAVATARRLAEQVEATRQTFVFEGIGRRQFNELLESAPPKEEDIEFDPDIFIPALLAAGCVEPGLTLEQAQRIYDEWTDAEVTALFLAAFGANRTARDIPFINAGTDTTQDSGSNSITAPVEV